MGVRFPLLPLMKKWLSFKCSGCGGHGVVADETWGAADCSDCEGSGRLFCSNTDTVVLYPSGPFKGRWPGIWKETVKWRKETGYKDYNSNDYFFIRTVKKGKIKIQGKYYKVNDPRMPYNGELDNIRFAFYRYPNYPRLEDKVFLWGTEEYYKAETEKEIDELDGKQPNVINGYIHWDCWEEVKEDTRMESSHSGKVIES